MPRAASSVRRSGHRRVRRIAALIAVLSVLAAAVGVLDLVVTNASVADGQRAAAHRLARSWHEPTATPGRAADGVSAATSSLLRSGAIGVLEVPRFGADYVRVISEGTTDAVLDRGDIGHYAGTALPGQVGNMALAGHREAHGASLLHIVDLRRGDRIVVETSTRVYTYRVTGSRQVDASAVGAVAAVPWHPSATPTKRLITLQSCTPPLIDTFRYVVWGELESSVARP